MRKSYLAKAREMIKGARNRHADALWQIERVWNKLTKHDYARRKELMDAAIDLSKISKTIDTISKKYNV